jgi:hypothetical protein
MNTWLLCEACIHSESQKLFPKEKLLEAWQSCSGSCLSLVAIFISNSLQAEKQVFDCFLSCRECYNECLLSQEEDILYCGNVCDKCAEMIKELLLFNLN